MTHLASLGRRVSGFFTGLGGAGALAVLGDPHSGTVGILTNLLPSLYRRMVWFLTSCDDGKRG